MSNRSAFTRKLLLASTSALSFLIASAGQAQQAPAAPGADSAVQEVVVSGFRASQQKALDNKRESDLPIESIAPEDIGKMPDQNVAEALQRLPGVQIDRSQGVGTSVLIDGLRQNLTTLNGDTFLTGKEFYVSGEGSGGGAGGNAQYGSLEGVPSEEIGGIDVYKNPKASITEGGLGGTIDLKTRDPLAQPVGWTLGGNFRMTMDQGQNDWTPVGTVVGSYNFNNKVAVTASFSYDWEKTQTDEYQSANRGQWAILNDGTVPTANQALSAANYVPMQSYMVPQLGYFSDIDDDRTTIGSSLGIAAKLTDSITTRVNWFYSRENDTSLTYSDKVWFNGSGTTAPYSQVPGINPTLPYSIGPNGVVQNGTFVATGAESATLYQNNVSTANNLQWMTSYDAGGALRGSVDASYSYATSDLQAAQADVEHSLYNTAAGVPASPGAPGCNNGAATCLGSGNAPYQFQYSNGGTSGLPTVKYLSDVLTNPAYTTFKSNWAWANLTSQQNYAIKADVQYDPTFVKGIETTLSSGFRYGSRDVDQTFGRYLINGEGDGAGTGTCNGTSCGPWIYYQDPGYGDKNVPFSTATTNPNLAKTVNIFGVGNTIVKNPSTSGITNPSSYLNAIWSQAGVPNNTETFFVDGLSSFNVQEKTYSGYVMGDFGSAANRFHLNVGVRFVHTDLTINNGAPTGEAYVGTASWNGVDADIAQVTTHRSYDDVLPTMNFVLDASDTEKIRFGAARVVSPQDLFSLGVGQSYNFTRVTGSRANVRTGALDGFAFAGGTEGNAQLDPYRATQTEISYENYFSRSGLVSVGGFYKQVDNFVETENIATTVMDDFGGTTANVSQPVNAGHGKIFGLELGGQYAFDNSYYSWLDGFGVAANYTRSQSYASAAAATSFSDAPGIPGVSKNSVTGTLFYEMNGFSARGSYTWRDKAVNDSLVGSTFTFANAANVLKTYQVYSAPYGQLDMQLGYDINEHLGLTFSIQNVTDAAQHTYLQWPDQPFSYDDAGRRFFLGGKFKL